MDQPLKQSASRRRWLQRQHRDPYFRQAREHGYRSRSAFKLLDIQQRWKLLRPGAVVVDLGAAPGGWSQVVVKETAPGGRVIAVDRLPMKPPLSGVEFIQAQIPDPALSARVQNLLGAGGADLVISDMAPNISGIAVTDQARSVQLAWQVLALAGQWLRPGGGLLIKLFHGPQVQAWRASAGRFFERARSLKPAASRSASGEFYWLGQGRNHQRVAAAGDASGYGIVETGQELHGPRSPTGGEGRIDA